MKTQEAFNIKELSNQTKKDEMIYFILSAIYHGHLISPVRQPQISKFQ